MGTSARLALVRGGGPRREAVEGHLAIRCDGSVAGVRGRVTSVEDVAVSIISDGVACSAALEAATKEAGALSNIAANEDSTLAYALDGCTDNLAGYTKRTGEGRG